MKPSAEAGILQICVFLFSVFVLFNEPSKIESIALFGLAVFSYGIAVICRAIENLKGDESE